MKSSYKFSIALMAGLFAGAAVDRATHGQQVKPTPVYLISEVDTITEPAAIRDYGSKVHATFAPFDGHYHFVVAGGKTESLDGDPPPQGIVVIAFDSSEAAHAWYNSPAYQAILPLRLKSSTGNFIIVDGT